MKNLILKELNLNKVEKVHFIGIGGIGISSIARMMLMQGKEVSGSDLNESKITKELKKLGAKVRAGHHERNLNPKTELVVYTIAVPENNPELKKARKLGIKTLTYPETLGLISKNFFTIAISGTHGKTTTAAMTAKILIDAGFEPTVIVGSLLKDAKSNFIAGKGKFFVVEACEYKKSFLNLEPKILAITNIDRDHLDYYKNLKKIQNAFLEFAVKIPKDGFLVCNSSDFKTRSILKSVKCKVLSYNDIKAKFKLNFPGWHNIENAKVAFAIASILKIDEKDIIHSLENYAGTWRRFDFKGKTKKGVLIYDDYAHHPTEVKATLAAFREIYPKKKITVVFQPHLYSRTKLLLNEFAKSFSNADEIVLIPIYAAREEKDETISSEMLKEKINQNRKKVRFFDDFQEASKYLKNISSKNDLIITMGAGDVYKIGEKLVS